MKCPNCGHKIDFNKTYTDNEIMAMMNDKSPRLKLLLKGIIRKIRNTIPSNDVITALPRAPVALISPSVPISIIHIPVLKLVEGTSARGVVTRN